MFDPWDYPPEADFNQSQARLYGLPEIWGAQHDERLIPDLVKKWLSSSRQYPRWIVEQWQTTRVSGHAGPRFYYEDWDRPSGQERPDWRVLYADELAESNGLVYALSQSEAEVYRIAKLSKREVEVMRMYTAGFGRTDTGEWLGTDDGSVAQYRRSAIGKLKVAFSPSYLYMDEHVRTIS